MKTILLTALICFAAIGLKAQLYVFQSGQLQEVRFDQKEKTYFVEKEQRYASEILIKDSLISVATFMNGEWMQTAIRVDVNKLDSIQAKSSFKIQGFDLNTKKSVTVAFWFIGEELDEISCIDEENVTITAYHDLSIQTSTAALQPGLISSSKD